ncbi:MAG: metallopeptidase family protein [Solirubrobacteraceae bacterium]|nr:metallopeptidase family protein [Patulibacter sp.]
MPIFHHYPSADGDRWAIRPLPEEREAVEQWFAERVTEALDELPQQFLDTLKDVPVVISDDGHAFGAYGLYHGATIARPEWGAQIFIYRDTLLRDFGRDPEKLAQQIRRVVRHELGHHLGFNEQGVADLGL